jgi:hypothetical protein
VIGGLRRPRSLSVLHVCALLAAFHSVLCCADDQVDLKATWDRWHKRSADVPTVQVELTEDDSGNGAFCRHRSDWATRRTESERLRHAHFVVLGQMTYFNRLAWEYDDRNTGIFPFDRELYLDQFREEVSTKRLDASIFSGFQVPTLEWKEPVEYVSTFDGTRRAALWPRERPQLSTAVVWRSPPFLHFSDLYFDAFLDAVPSLDEIVYQPILLMYRPFHPWFAGIDEGRCTILRRGVMIDGHECLLIRERSRNNESQIARLFFVCPALDFAVLRYRGDAGPAPHLQMDIAYKHDEKMGWIPERWTINRFDASTGAVLEATRIEVSAISFDRPVLTNDNFAITFPRGTWIRNFKTDEQVLIRWDGSERRVLDFEFRALATDDKLMNSEAGDAGDLSTSRYDWLCWNVGCSVVMVGGCFMVICGYAGLRRASRTRGSDT